MADNEIPGEIIVAEYAQSVRELHAQLMFARAQVAHLTALLSDERAARTETKETTP